MRSFFCGFLDFSKAVLVFSLLALNFGVNPRGVGRAFGYTTCMWLGSNCPAAFTGVTWFTVKTCKTVAGNTATGIGSCGSTCGSCSSRWSVCFGPTTTGAGYSCYLTTITGCRY